jgi:hypothetical protein
LRSLRATRERMEEIARAVVEARWVDGAPNCACEPVSRGTVISAMRQKSVYLRKGGPEIDKLDGVAVWRPHPQGPVHVFPMQTCARFAAAIEKIKAMDPELSWRQVVRRTQYPAVTVRFVFHLIGR